MFPGNCTARPLTYCTYLLTLTLVNVQMSRRQTGSSCQGLRHNRVAMRVILMGGGIIVLPDHADVNVLAVFL